MNSTKIRILCVTVFLALVTTIPASARDYNSPTVDGVISVSPDDWNVSDQIHFDPDGDSAWGDCNDLHGLWVTWDDQGIYLGVQGQIWGAPCEGSPGNSVNLYLDVDFGQGKGVSDISLIDPDENLGPIGRNLRRTLTVGAGFGCDFGYTAWGGQWDLGFLDLTDPSFPVNRIDEITEARDLVDRTGYELFLAWDFLYPAASEHVPPGTVMAAVIAQVGGGDSLSPESMPDGLDPEFGDRFLETPIVFSVDQNGDGIADPAGPVYGETKSFGQIKALYVREPR